jgi:hypothetical protein
LAAQVGERVTFSFTLDAFGDDGQADSFGEGDDAGDEEMSRCLLVHAGDEGTVDLDLVDREVSECGQRAEPGAEVVQGESYPELAEVVTDRQAGRGIHQTPRLGDLEDEAVASQAVPVKLGCDSEREVGR